jgi:hypothetical protein
MCTNERLRVLKQRIAEESNKSWQQGFDDTVTLLIWELQELCPHVYKEETDDDDVVQCTCCQKLFEYRRA